MCGIVGLFSKRANWDISKALEAIGSRGPDNTGVYQDEFAYLGHTRLSIIDETSRSNQPFTIDGRYYLTFNGEVYNYRSLAKELNCEYNLNLQGFSDTEVLYHLCRLKGVNKAVDIIEGMFAFVWYDSNTRDYWLVRDKLGIKPLFYQKNDDDLFFGSTPKAVFSLSNIKPSYTSWAKGLFLMLGSYPPGILPFENLEELLPGQIYSSKDKSQLEYFNVNTLYGSIPKISSSNPFLDSIKKHLISDVPICIYLSDGKDSLSIYLNIIQRLKKHITGFTLKGDDRVNSDDGELAKYFTEIYDQKHYIHKVDLSEFEISVDHIFGNMTLPSRDGFNTYFVSKMSKDYKVSLSGVGGDELLMGYAHYKSIPIIYKLGPLISIFPKRIWQVSVGKLGPKWRFMQNHVDSVESIFLMKRMTFLPEEINTKGSKQAYEILLQRAKVIAGSESNIKRKIQLLDIHFYLQGQLLRDSDWASMANSQELRTPYVDAELWGQVLSWPYIVDGKKMELFQGLSHIEKIIKRKKSGFSFPTEDLMKKTFNLRSRIDVYDKIYSLFEQKIND